MVKAVKGKLTNELIWFIVLVSTNAVVAGSMMFYFATRRNVTFGDVVNMLHSLEISIVTIFTLIMIQIIAVTRKPSSL